MISISSRVNNFRSFLSTAKRLKTDKVARVGKMTQIAMIAVGHPFSSGSGAVSTLDGGLCWDIWTRNSKQNLERRAT